MVGASLKQDLLHGTDETLEVETTSSFEEGVMQLVSSTNFKDRSEIAVAYQLKH